MKPVSSVPERYQNISLKSYFTLQRNAKGYTVFLLSILQYRVGGKVVSPRYLAGKLGGRMTQTAGKGVEYYCSVTSSVWFPSVGYEVRSLRNRREQNILNQDSEHWTGVTHVRISFRAYTPYTYLRVNFVFPVFFKNLCVLGVHELYGLWLCSPDTASGMMIWKGNVYWCLL